jgi:N-acetylmuramoyl-L-alanine amidase
MNRDVALSELPLLTLRGVNMPALELEVGYITSLSTETELKDDAYIDRLVSAVYKGIKQYKETLMLAGRQP